MKFDNSNLPSKFAGCSPFMVNELLSFGYADDQVIALLEYADDNCDHPDWSEDSRPTIKRHFEYLAHEVFGGES